MVYWDADELKDLLVGRSDGMLVLYTNVNTDEDPQFDGGCLLQVDGSTFDVGSRATPGVADWISDGRKDLVVGALDGYVNIFLNEGTDTEPLFLQATRAQDNGADLDVYGNRSSPVALDLDGDGNKDLLTGNTYGQLLLYHNVGTDTEPLFSGYVQVESEGAPIDLDGTQRSRPFVCDWTEDGERDVLIGYGDGLVYLFQGLPAAPGVTDLAATYEAGVLYLDWTAVPGASYYNIYRQVPPGDWAYHSQSLIAGWSESIGLPPEQRLYRVTAVHP